MRLNPRKVWGGLLTVGGLYEFYALLNDQEGDTLSEVTRDVFGCDCKRGKVTFTMAYAAFSVWFVPHIAARAVEAAEDATETASPTPVEKVIHRVLWPTGT